MVEKRACTVLKVGGGQSTKLNCMLYIYAVDIVQCNVQEAFVSKLTPNNNTNVVIKKDFHPEN